MTCMYEQQQADTQVVFLVVVFVKIAKAEH